MRRLSARPAGVLLSVALAMVASQVTGSASPPARQATAPVRFTAPRFYRPVVVDGKTFPLARSNFLSLVRVFDNWHAPRLRLIDGRWRLVGRHEGIDIAAERGTPIVSMTPGTVENVGWTFYGGTRVGVRGDDGRYYFYAHLSRVAIGITVGARVAAGTVLGLVGNTGYGEPGHRDEFPPHLHIGVEAGAAWIDPYAMLASLYRSTVQMTTRAQATLDRLAASGDGGAWDREAARVYLSPAAARGE